MNPFSHLFICRFSDVHTSPSLVLVFRLAVTCCIVLALPGSLLLGMGGVHEKPILAPSPCTVPGHPPDLTCGIHTSPNNRHPSQALHPPALPAGSFSGSLCAKMGGGEGGAALSLLLSRRGWLFSARVSADPVYHIRAPER